MSYTSKEQIVAQFTVDEIEDISEERMALAISQTDELIHSYLAPTGLYTLPLDPVPKLIETIAIDIARWELMAGERIYIEEKFRGLEIRYNNALKTLEQIRKGVLTLSFLESSRSGAIQIKAPPRCFTLEGLNSF